jgi:hypothetical protein
MTEAERVLDALNRRAPNLDGIATIDLAQHVIKKLQAEIEALRVDADTIINRLAEANARGQLELDAAIADKAAIVQPVAYMDADGNFSDNNDHGCFSTPLYTTPPRSVG